MQLIASYPTFSLLRLQSLSFLLKTFPATSPKQESARINGKKEVPQAPDSQHHAIFMMFLVVFTFPKQGNHLYL